MVDGQAADQAKGFSSRLHHKSIRSHRAFSTRMGGRNSFNFRHGQYEGPKQSSKAFSKNPLAFKHYNADELVAGKTMKDHLRFSVTYWHTIRGQLADMFGVGTAIRPWEDGTNSMKMAETRVRVAFEFLEKLGAPFYAFHDRDVAPEGKSLRETNRNLDAIVKVLKAEQQRTGCSCFGARPACSCIRALRTARPRAAMRTSSRMRPRRSRRPSR
jgi:hypothetical protein